VERVDYNVASFRYRSLIPAYELSSVGTQSVFTTIDEVSVTDADIFVFVKVFGQKHLDFATALQRAGRPYVLDLCDNIFWADYAPKRQIGGRDNFLQMAMRASAVVVTCNALAKVVREYLPADQVPVIIPDASFSLQDHLDLSDWFEAMQIACRWSGKKFLTSSDVEQFAKRPLRGLVGRSLRYLSAPAEAKAAAKRLLLKRKSVLMSFTPPAQADQDQQGRRRKLIWFGKHGTSYSKAGMQSLTTIIPYLIKIDRVVPIELVIISNNRAKFHDRLLRLPFPTRYRSWSNEAVFDELSTSDVFLMPNETDGFSACKSANRAVMALEMGVPVIATWLDSLEPLGDAIVIDDWERGLDNYLLNHTERSRALSQASQVINTVYAPKVVGEHWQDIARLAQQQRPSEPPVPLVVDAELRRTRVG
jgi:glycosyltransferase involved in cell wall biosynthesis